MRQFNHRKGFCNKRIENDTSMGIAFCATKFCVTKCCGYQNRMLDWQEPTLCQNVPIFAKDEIAIGL
jgi:hypothetical protein